MRIKNIEPLFQLKGHQASVLAVEYAKTSILGEHILASGSGNKKQALILSKIYLMMLFRG